MRICHISDTHDVHQDLNMLVPKDTEILFFTGDLTYKGAEWELNLLLEQFIRLKQRIPYIVGCLGNHELGAEGKEDEWKMRFASAGVTLLDHESIEIEGIKIFGSPWTPWFFDWAYGYESVMGLAQSSEKLLTAEEIWDKIPKDTQVLLSHGPPHMIRDWCPNGNVGCSRLRWQIEQIPSITHHLFGHIHSGYGIEIINGVTYINSSIMDNKYRFVNKPHCFDLEF